jgi:cardiolipin synthase
LHAKIAVIDHYWCTVGSYNLDVRSLLHAEEVNAVILGKRFAAQLEALFQADIMRSMQVLLSDWRKRPWSQRMLQSLAHRFRYWL